MVSIPKSDLVQSYVVNTHPPSPIFLGYYDNRRFTSKVSWSNCYLLKQFLQLILCFFCFHSMIFDNGESNSSCISCSTFLLGGVPLGSQNTSMYVCKWFSNWCFYSLIHLSRYAFNYTDSYSFLLCIKTSNKKFLLELMIFFTWLALMSEMFEFPLCAFMMEYISYLIKQYWFTLIMKIASLLYTQGI